MNSERLCEIRTLRSRWALSHFNKHYKHRTEEFWLECSAILHNNKHMLSRQPMRIECPITWSEVSQWEGGRSINPGQQTAGFEYRFQSWHLWLLKQNKLPGKALFWVYCQPTDSQVKYWVFFPRKIFQKSRLITTTRTSLGGARLTVILNYRQQGLKSCWFEAGDYFILSLSWLSNKAKFHWNLLVNE